MNKYKINKLKTALIRILTNRKNNNPFKSGDKVRYNKNDDGVYIVYLIYSDTKVSLGLRDYPYIEQDFQTDIKDIRMA